MHRDNKKRNKMITKISTNSYTSSANNTKNQPQNVNFKAARIANSALVGLEYGKQDLKFAIGFMDFLAKHRLIVEMGMSTHPHIQGEPATDCLERIILTGDNAQINRNLKAMLGDDVSIISDEEGERSIRAFAGANDALEVAS